MDFYAVEGHAYFLLVVRTVVNNTIFDARTCEVLVLLVTKQDPENMYGSRCSKNMDLLRCFLLLKCRTTNRNRMKYFGRHTSLGLMLR